MAGLSEIKASKSHQAELELGLGLGKGSKKKEKVEFSIEVSGWGHPCTDFPLNFFFFKKNISLTPLKLLKNHLKTNLFFQFLVGGPSSARLVVTYIYKNPYKFN